MRTATTTTIGSKTQSYTIDDVAILSYDSALLCNPETPTDLIDLIEFANVQVLELRYYDRVLTRQMAKMYDDMEQADRMPRFRRMRQYHAIMSQLMESYAEISEITETTVAGKPAFTADATFTEEGKGISSTLYFVFDGSTEYQILTQAADENWDKLQPTFAAMLNSMQITGTSASPSAGA